MYSARAATMRVACPAMLATVSCLELESHSVASTLSNRHARATFDPYQNGCCLAGISSACDSDSAELSAQIRLRLPARAPHGRARARALRWVPPRVRRPALALRPNDGVESCGRAGGRATRRATPRRACSGPRARARAYARGGRGGSAAARTRARQPHAPRRQAGPDVLPATEGAMPCKGTPEGGE